MKDLLVNVLAFVIWALLLLAILVAALLAVIAVILVVRELVRTVRKWHRDRFRRAFRQGKFEIRCDSIVPVDLMLPEGNDSHWRPVTQPCGRLAHWMLIRPDIPWGKGEKRCWRHHRRSAYMLGIDGQSVYMPVNRRTAWVDDPPPNKREGADV